LLHIKLVEEQEVEKTARAAASGGSGMTIGDILKR
jgi:ribosome-binding protein aMBF1 (putative translation factor)